MGDKIELDLDRNRIIDILSETYRTCQDVLETKVKISLEDFVSKIDKFLSSNRVASVPVRINLPAQKYPELIIEVNFQKKSVIARMLNKKKRILLNRYLTKL
jgi:hypothetical protein